MADDRITITIDGVEVKARRGQTVLEAAIEAGIYIPYLCYHPGMEPFAACRMCVVEVENGRGFPASCTLPVAEGMEVRNNSSQVHELRRDVMELLIADHPHGCLTCHRVDLCGPQDVCLRHVSVNDRCVTCPKNERCELKDTVRYLGMEMESPLEYKYRDLPVETGDPFYDRDYNLCIVCGRCVRVCEEVRGDNAITFTERAGQALVGTSAGTSLLESGCEFCGACLDVCPVGALVESDHKWEKAQQVERTICSHCPVGCQLNLEVNRFEKVVRSVPEISSPANRGQGCFKGKFGLDFVNSKKRLKTPLIRRNGTLEKATWEEAFDYVAERLDEHRGDTFAMLSASDSTNEEHYLAQKFARVVMNSNNVDYTSNTQPNAVNAQREVLGFGAATNPIWDLENSDCILVFNANVTEEHNVVAVPIKRAIKEGAKLIVIDPREVELTRYADLWLRPKPGTELLLLNGLVKALLHQGLERREWLYENCSGLEPLREAMASLEIGEISEQTGIPQDTIDAAMRVYGPSEHSSIVYGIDNVPEELHKDCASALSALSLLTGNLGKPSSGIYPLKPGANSQGAWDVGCVPTHLPGTSPLEDTEARQRVEEEWSIQLPQAKGLGQQDMLRSGQVKALILIGGLDHPTADALQTLQALDFLVVQDSFLSAAAQRADVVLPRSSFAEKTGTYTNLERRIQSVRPVISPKNSAAKPESWAICHLAQCMGAKGFEFSDTAAVMEEIARIAPIYGGVSHQRLENEGRLVFRPDVGNPLPTQVLYSDKEYHGIQWPCPTTESSGVEILFASGFGDAKPRIPIPDYRKIELAEDSAFPLLFTPGRVLLQSERKMTVIKGLSNRIEREEIIEVHRDDGQVMGLREGDMVELQTNGASLKGRLAFREGLQRGVVSSTQLFGQLMVEVEASQSPDPMSEIAGLNIAAARLVKVES